MSLRSRYHVKASMVLTIADNLCICNYKTSLQNNKLIRILIVRMRLEFASYCLCV